MVQNGDDRIRKRAKDGETEKERAPNLLSDDVDQRERESVFLPSFLLSFSVGRFQLISGCG